MRQKGLGPQKKRREKKFFKMKGLGFYAKKTETIENTIERLFSQYVLKSITIFIEIEFLFKKPSAVKKKLSSNGMKFWNSNSCTNVITHIINSTVYDPFPLLKFLLISLALFFSVKKEGEPCD